MVEGKELSASNLFKQMRKAAAKTYKADLEKVVKESRALLDEMDRIEAKQMQLAAQKKDAKPGKEKELAEQEVQLAQQMKDVQARETELFNRVGEDRKVTKA
jgi:predicted nuclease with TOPRIM domain